MERPPLARRPPAAFLRRPPQPTHAAHERLDLWHLELQKSMQAVADAFVDLSVSTDSVERLWQSALQMRCEFLQHQPEAVSSVAVAEVKENWIGKLSQLYSKQVRRPLEKNEIVYTVEDKAADGASIFTATVSAIDFRGGPYKGEPSRSKKLAEHSAASVALDMEFGGDAVAMTFAKVKQEPETFPERGVKRNAEEAVVSPKQKLNEQLRLLVDREISKDCIAYHTDQVEGVYQSSVCVVCYDNQTFAGQPAASKKEAEQSAAEAALVALEDVLRPAVEAQQEKKRRKLEEKRRRDKERKGGNGEAVDYD
ncbi:unnamed protein product [Effrenium voratum]|uniref:DRBM domain-containing protein n=2 Tax=Effrenium voratum TaxID=2562239 RepID=A0AA36JMC3_9DINO|nr:unnamed protein product [Effrenium voratum]CAJ1461149.1 unnamed protein product [Effrenium voratum]